MVDGDSALLPVTPVKCPKCGEEAMEKFAQVGHLFQQLFPSLDIDDFAGKEMHLHKRGLCTWVCPVCSFMKMLKE